MHMMCLSMLLAPVHCNIVGNSSGFGGGFGSGFFGGQQDTAGSSFGSGFSFGDNPSQNDTGTCMYVNNACMLRMVLS